MKETAHDVVIIGCGPAGAAAAIQLCRSGIGLVVFERDDVGGLVRNANLVENYPGFPGGIVGIELARLIERQLELTNVAISFEEVFSLRHENGLFIAETASGLTRARFAIVASGTKPRRLADVDIEERAEKNIFSEVYPLLDVSGKRIIIIGAGDAAFDYALNLSRNNYVTILNRSEVTRCLPLLMERCGAVESIRYLENHPVVKVGVEGTSLAVTALDVKDGSEAVFRADYLVTAIGREPNLDFIEEGLLKKADGLKKDGRLFMIGDVINSPHRQVTISVGDGVRAAMEIYDHI